MQTRIPAVAVAGVLLSCGGMARTVSFKTIYSFNGADGSEPAANLIRDAAGNFYGTAYAGGSGNNGAVFKLDSTGHETVLYNFTGGADGGTPRAGLVLDSSGNLYGTTELGGDLSNFEVCPAGCGVVFKLDPAGTETVLYTFQGGADGAEPFAGVIRDSAGNLYGTTFSGGFSGSEDCSPGGCGVVFQVDTAGAETVLYTFHDGLEGAGPMSPLVADAAGNLYGDTPEGASSFGSVFRLDTAGNFTILHAFTGGKDGGGPSALTRDAAGNIYGATDIGGTANFGVVFELSPTGSETVLHNFTGGTGGYYSFTGVILDSAGHLYGSTFKGGAHNGGVIFRLSPAGKYLAYSLPRRSGGANTNLLLVGRQVYGTCSAAGAHRDGYVFKALF